MAAPVSSAAHRVTQSPRAIGREEGEHGVRRTAPVPVRVRGAVTRAARSKGGRSAIEVKCIDVHGVTRTGTVCRSGVARSIAESGA